MAIHIRMSALVAAAFALALTASAQTLSPAEQGRKLYLSNNCYGCHGDVGGGSAYGAPALRTDGVELGDLTEAVHSGEDRGMPAYPSLTAAQINDLYAYFQTMGSTAEPVFYLWWEPIPIAGLQVRPPLLYADAQPRKIARR